MTGEHVQKRGQRYQLTQADLRKLSIAKRPAIDQASGKTYLVDNSEGKPYRFLLTDAAGSQVAGFGVYVGKTKTTYEVQVGDGSSTVREALGSVYELSFDEALKKAIDCRMSVQKTGQGAKRAERAHKKGLATRSITVEECFNHYIERLTKLMGNDQLKASSVEAVRQSLARIKRPEVDLARKEVRDLVADPNLMTQAWESCRRSSMLLSNQLTVEQKKKLEVAGDWWKLKATDLEAMGFRGRHIQRALAAGSAATEHTFGDVHRSIKLVIELEADASQAEGRPAELVLNPTKTLYQNGYFRDHTKLRQHYRRAQVRNPLGEAADDQSLQRTMKALIQRRDYYLDRHQRVGVDYLFITLLWGLRRNEGAILKWYQDCSPGELSHEECSWVWLASNAEEMNPTTGRRGSQAFLHDTKTGVIQHIPVCYFAERILQWRWEERLETLTSYEALRAKAKAELASAEKRTIDEVKLSVYRKAIRRVEFRKMNAGWVFPARSTKAKDGHYKDSKSLLQYLRVDSGRLDLSKDIDIGLTVHDFRRTMGRFASKLLSGRMVSELLKHFSSRGIDGNDTMSTTSEHFYTDQEWADVRLAMTTVEEAMIRSSPRVWNRLKGPDKPVLDEVNDPPIQISWTERSLRTVNKDEEE